MPKKTQYTINLHKYERIRDGRANDNDKQNFSFANNFFDFLTNLSKCTGNSQEFCIQPGNNLASQQTTIFEKDLIPKGYLKNIFVYLSQVIDNIKEINVNQIKGLLNFCSIFLKIDFSNSTITLSNELAVAYLNLFTRIISLSNITEAYKKDNTTLKIIDLLNLTNQFIPTWVQLNNNTEYPIFEYLTTYFESIGNLADRLRDKNHSISTIVTPTMKLIQLLEPYLDYNQRNDLIMYCFSDKCISNDIKDVLTVYQAVFNSTTSDPCNVYAKYEQIKDGTKGYDDQISLTNNLNIGKQILNKINSENSLSLTNKQSINILNYFKRLIQETNKVEKKVLSDDFINDLCQLLSKQFDILKNNDNSFMYYRSSFALFLALLKNSSAKNNSMIISTLKTTFDPMEKLLNCTLQSSSNDKTNDILSIFKIFADVVHLGANDIHTILLEDKKLIANEISKLDSICFKIKTCHSDHALDQSFETLGRMVRNLSRKNRTTPEKDGAQYIQAITTRLIQDANNNSISETRVANFAYAFLVGLHDRKDHKKRNGCMQIFNLTSCYPANQTAEQTIDTTTFIPETITKRAITHPVTTVTEDSTIPTVIPLPLNETVIPVNNITEANLTTTALPTNISSTSFNQTASDTANTQNLDPLSFGSALAYGASAAHGVANGLISGFIQYFATKHSRHGDQASKARAIAIYSSLLIPAAFSTAFPIMLFKIQEQLNQGNEDEAQQLWDNLLLQALPTFISSASFNLVFYTIIELTQLCSDRLRTIIQGLFSLGTAYNVYLNPLETGVQLGTSFVTSLLTYSGLNWFFPVKNRQSSNIEAANKYYVEYNANAIEYDSEIQPLNEEKKVFENQATKKTYQFICKPELDEVKKLSKNNLDQLINLIKTIEIYIENLKQQSEAIKTDSVLNAFSKSIKDNNHALNILNVQFKSAETLYSLLSDNIHLSACEMYTLNRKKDFVSAMDKLGNVFKLMETNFKNLQGEVKAVIGYTEAKSENFSDEVKTQLSSLSQTIIFPLSKVTLYKDRYSNANAVEKTEKRCKAEANQDLFNVIAKVDQSIIKKNKGYLCKNRNTFAFSSGSDNDLRISAGSSSAESELSTVSGNSAHNPIIPQQTLPLLTSFQK